MAATTSFFVRLAGVVPAVEGGRPDHLSEHLRGLAERVRVDEVGDDVRVVLRVLVVPAREQCPQERPRTGLLAPRGNLEPSAVAGVRALAPAALHEATRLAAPSPQPSHRPLLCIAPLSNGEKVADDRTANRQVPGHGFDLDQHVRVEEAGDLDERARRRVGPCRRTRRGRRGSSPIPTRPRRTE